MNACRGWADFLNSTLRYRQRQPMRLLPRTAADELPPHPEQRTIDGIRRRELDALAALAATDGRCARAALYGR